LRYKGVDMWESTMDYSLMTVCNFLRRTKNRQKVSVCLVVLKILVANLLEEM